MAKKINIPDRQECFRLLFKYKVPDNIIRHSLKNAQISLCLGRKLKEKGEKVDLNLLYAAALLHDIGKLKADKIESHTEISAKILEAEGYRALKNPVRKHFFGQLETWEEKLVFYVDKIVKHDYLVTLKERLEDVKKRYPENTAFIEKAWTYAEKMEREIFKKTGENFQNIKKNLDTYEITNHRG